MPTDAQRIEIDTLREKLVFDPKTIEIASNLHMDPDDYAGLVAHFKVTGEEPQFLVVADEVLKKHGHAPPSLEQLKGFISGEKKIVDATGRTSSFTSLPKVTASFPRDEPAAKVTRDENLEAELKKKMKREFR